jgi:hypothetical protein
LENSLEIKLPSKIKIFVGRALHGIMPRKTQTIDEAVDIDREGSAILEHIIRLDHN